MGGMLRADIRGQVHDPGVDLQNILHLVDGLYAKMGLELFPSRLHTLHGGGNPVCFLMRDCCADSFFGCHFLALPLRFLKLIFRIAESV